MAFEEVFRCALLNNHWRLQRPADAFVPVLNVPTYNYRVSRGSRISALYPQHLYITKGTQPSSVGVPWDNEACERKLRSMRVSHSLWTWRKSFSMCLLVLGIAREFCSTWIFTPPFTPPVSFHHTWWESRTELHAKIQVAKLSVSLHYLCIKGGSVKEIWKISCYLNGHHRYNEIIAHTSEKPAWLKSESYNLHFHNSWKTGKLFFELISKWSLSSCFPFHSGQNFIAVLWQDVIFPTFRASF